MSADTSCSVFLLVKDHLWTSSTAGETRKVEDMGRVTKELKGNCRIHKLVGILHLLPMKTPKAIILTVLNSTKCLNTCSTLEELSLYLVSCFFYLFACTMRKKRPRCLELSYSGWCQKSQYCRGTIFILFFVFPERSLLVLRLCVRNWSQNIRAPWYFF